MTPAGPLDVDAGLLRGRLNREPFLVRHRLADHPAFDIERLIALARRLPPEAIESNAGDLPIDIDPSLTPGTGLAPDETLMRLRGRCSWVVMKGVDRIDEYAALMRDCLDQIAAAAGEAAAGMTRPEAFIFVSSPGSVTPYHLDPELNFLLQIRGTKICRLLPRSVVSPRELEERFAEAHRNLRFRESDEPLAAGFGLTPGVGLHIPVAAPHWVRNGDEVSVSFSVTFRTGASERESALFRFNAHLRRLGIDPAPPHRSAARDAIKYGAFQGLRGLFRPIKAVDAAVRPLLRGKIGGERRHG